MDRLDNDVRRRLQESVDQMGPGIGFDLVPRSPLNSVQMPAKQNNGLFSSSANQTHPSSWRRTVLFITHDRERVVRRNGIEPIVAVFRGVH
jgi:hypothetical protein